MEQIAVERIVAVVDDDAAIRRSLAAILESEGYLPRVFASVEEVLESGDLKSSHYLITDIQMPGMDGWDLHSHAVATYPDLPVIVMTGDPVASPKDKRALPPTILYKPIKVVELLAAIQSQTRHIAC